jgi:hypothetical protein
MATRKRATPPPEPAPVPEQELSVDSLAAFLQTDAPDRERLAQALRLASEAAAMVTGTPIGSIASHGIRHGVHLLASQLLIQDQLDTTPTAADIPLVVRYLWKTADAGRQPQ